MNGKNIITTISVACATTALVLAVAWPVGLNAKPNKLKMNLLVQAKEIKNPTLKTNGCELTILKTDKEFKPDVTPEVQIKVVNKTDKPVSFNANITPYFMPGMGNGLVISRIMPMPKSGPSRSCPISLAAGETKIITVAMEVSEKKPSYVALKVGKKQVNSYGV